MQVLVDVASSKFGDAQAKVKLTTYEDWMAMSNEEQKAISGPCETYQVISYSTYLAIYFLLFILLITVTCVFKRTVKHKYFSEHKYHNKMTNKYIVWLTISLIIKGMLVTKITSYSSTTLSI